MINIGKFNKMKVAREVDFGLFLDAGTGNMSDDILLPNGNLNGMELNEQDEVNAFIYRDSKDRLVATLRAPLAQVGEMAYLKVVGEADFGSFIDIGLERDVLVPKKEENYMITVGASYLFYIYVDKTDRLAATTFIDRYLEDDAPYSIGDEVSATVYGFQTNGSIMVAVDDKYRGVVLKNEYFERVVPGEKLNLRVKKIYDEDGKLGLTPRKSPKEERTQLQDDILDYLKEHNGFMEYNDKSSPEDIKAVFHESKNYFKNALGGLMKKQLIKQDETGTYLIK
ncbi:S1-like domain-containing RNA-binding protein [Clostridium sp. JN-9]|uniref:CvfB family protein n=1 Tax=Clostridium sp. JN-9 TaxID=2507159 RepID=UPI000FFE30C7|nr:S1-like domain-containing RNA-binding protein [Clostridium sp. JN-9]QAT41131.1 DNA-binding protein [Clostridium sp. JN-9]